AGVGVANITATVQGGVNADGNLQIAKVQAAGFTIDTVTPTVLSITPSVPVITRAGVFKLAIQFSEAMNTLVSAAPAIVLTPSGAGATLSFASGTWDSTPTLYTASYNVSAAGGVGIPDVAVAISGGRSSNGNVQTPINLDQVFAIDTVTPTVTSITPGAA